MKKKKHICAYPAVKWLSLFGMLCFAILAGGLFFVTVYLVEEGFYRTDSKEMLDSRFYQNAASDANRVMVDLSVEQTDAVIQYLSTGNVAAVVIKNVKNDASFYYWRNESIKENTPDVYVYTGQKSEEGRVVWEISIDPDLPITTDEYYLDYMIVTKGFQYRFAIPVAAILAGILSIVFMLLFFSGIGRVPNSDEITSNYFTKIPFDVFTLILAIPALVGFMVAMEARAEEAEVLALCIFIISVFLWIVNVVHRVKQGNVFRNTVIWKLAVLAFKGIRKLIRNLPLLWKTLLVLGAVSLYEIIVIMLAGAWNADYDIILLLAIAFVLEKIVLYPLILYVVFMMKTLFKGGRELAEGNTEYKISLGTLLGEYKKHGENLNNLSDGIMKAVEERMRSERMKTELITNVSHDIKTPLTSVINYSDLIGSEVRELTGKENKTESEKLSEEGQQHLKNIEDYSEVLYRQSQKIRHLVEDLVEISKANSGNMEINPEEIEIGTMLSQAAGEYEERFEEKGLETVLMLPEEELKIMADRRKLWRIMDNLLQNIYKYAHKDTRVFLSAKEENGRVCIMFRNTSGQLIDVSAEELLERFTRGEKSRHEEGNGLGLAIAKSLTEVQNGEFRIAVDGDLFKVAVIFKQSV